MAILEEYLQSVGSAWTYDDTYGEFDGSLVTCCGVDVELDAPKCPECGNPNPVREGGLI